MKKLNVLLPLFLFSIIFIACSSKKTYEQETKTRFDLHDRLYIDSAYGFKVGDAFLCDSLDSYGFILIHIESEVLSFAPIKLATEGNDLHKILDGEIRFVPSNVDNPKSGDYGIECLGVIGELQINAIKKRLHFVDHFKFQHPLEESSAIMFGKVSTESLNNFIAHYRDSWKEQEKMITVTTLQNRP